jgi:hypothetical protein
MWMWVIAQHTAYGTGVYNFESSINQEKAAYKNSSPGAQPMQLHCLCSGTCVLVVAVFPAAFCAATVAAVRRSW